jgi:hypothetical protein
MTHTQSWAGQRGSALICVLMVTTLLATLSGALVLVVMSESMASANHGAAQQAVYAAEAGLEDTLGELQTTDWRVLPGAAVSACLRDAAQTPRAPDGAVLNLTALAAGRQAESDAVFAASPDGPVWRLFGHGPFSDLAPGRVNIPAAYLLIWVADDGEDGDGDAARDSNGRVMLRVEAYGSAGAHRSIEATVMLQILAEPPPADGSAPPPARTAVRVLSSREVR